MVQISVGLLWNCQGGATWKSVTPDLSNNGLLISQKGKGYIWLANRVLRNQEQPCQWRVPYSKNILMTEWEYGAKTIQEKFLHLVAIFALPLGSFVSHTRLSPIWVKAHYFLWNTKWNDRQHIFQKARPYKQQKILNCWSNCSCKHWFTDCNAWGEFQTSK